MNQEPQFYAVQGASPDVWLAYKIRPGLRVPSGAVLLREQPRRSFAKEARVHNNSVCYLVARVAGRVIYRLHCSDAFSFQMQAEKWDSLPEA